jgi:tetratricopeptide (TPR) repeat protein
MTRREEEKSTPWRYVRLALLLVLLSQGGAGDLPAHSQSSAAGRTERGEEPVAVQRSTRGRGQGTEPQPAPFNGKISTEEELFANVDRLLALRRVTESGLAPLVQFLRQNPEHPTGLFLLAQCHHQQGFTDTAEQILRQVENLRDRRPRLTLLLWKRHLQHNDLANAFALLPFISSRFPDEPQIKLLNAIFVEKTGRESEARIYYDGLLGLPRPPLGTASRLAAICLKDGDFSRSLNLCDRDLQYDPNYQPAVAGKAAALIKLGRSREALNVTLPALDRLPFDRRLNLLTSDAYLVQGDRVKGLEYLLRSLAVSSASADRVPAFKRAGGLAGELDSRVFAQLVTNVSSLVEQTSFGMQFHYDMSELFQNLQHHRLAFEHLQVCFKLDPDYVPVLTQMGRLLERAGDYEQASRLYDRVGKLKPLYYENSVWRDRLRKRLANRKRDISWRVHDLMTGKPFPL